ncbi:MAG: LptF/LptG family permease [Chitinophagales bacterium]
MKKLDRYIVGKFLGTFFFTVLLLCVVIVVIDLSERMDDFLENNAPVNLIFFQYYANFIPHTVLTLSPLFIFVSVIFFTSRMAYRTEIIAILASGISFYRVLFGPYFFAATLLVILQLFASHYWVPDANKDRLDFEYQYMRGQIVNRDKDIHLQIAPDSYIYLETFLLSDSSGRKFTLEQIDSNQNMVYKLHANRAKWNGEKGKWELTNYNERRIDGLKETITKGAKMDTTLNFHPRDFAREKRFKDAMTRTELNEYILKERQRGTPNLEFYEVERHRRTAVPFSTYILSIIALAVASRKVRGGMGLHVFIGIALSAGYIVALQFSTTFATNGNLSPLLGAWTPNLIFGVIAAWLLIKAPK